ncbi:MAG TPA: DedA family protein [Baekduia sp.]|uniref:DedA family protein n=1 Tax=Baekduia sp. TaxID=2600305 RepID=UPI002B6DAD19|nr:DedA family protein [Baekduia sp.]HMJ32778.1 DedA family protein [Baekduia sp.]
MTHTLVLASITGTLTDWVGQHGAYAVFFIMMIDAVLPAGGEITMLFAGALAAGAIADHHPVLLGHTLQTGLESYLVLAAAGTVGYLVGSLIGWAIGRYGGRPLLERHGRWLHLDAENLDRAERWFDRHGRSAVFLGRLTPVVRSFISIPAGALETPLVPYTLLTLLGSAIWCFAFAAVGWALGDRWDSVHRAFTGVEVLVVVVALAGGAVLLHRSRRGRVTRA